MALFSRPGTLLFSAKILKYPVSLQADSIMEEGKCGVVHNGGNEQDCNHVGFKALPPSA